MNFSLSPPPFATEPAPGQSRYGALAASLKARIVAGDWPPGAALPAEQALAAQMGVALGTLRQALALLVDQGLVDRVHGRGTFVRAGLSGAPMLRFFRFGSGPGLPQAAAGSPTGSPTGTATSSASISAAVPTSRILSRQVLPAPAAAAAAMGAVLGEPMLRLRRLRSLAGVPRLAEEIWLPLPLCAALQHSDPTTWGDLLYPHLATACGVHVHRAVDTIAFGQLGAADAKALKLPTGHPCAVVQRQAFDLTGRCVESRTTRGDAHAFHYTVAIS